MKSLSTFFIACLLSSAMAETKPEPVTVAELFTPQQTLGMKVAPSGKAHVTQQGKQWRVKGSSPVKITFVPANEKGVWDLSRYRLIGLPVKNNDTGVTTIRGQLNNGQLTGWSHHAIGFAVAPSGETAMLGFPFPLVENRYAGSDVFADQLAKPNGHRVHWRQFYPEDTRALVLQIKSSSGNIDLTLDAPQLAWPASKELDTRLQAMPYLDNMGQVRAVDWPGKAHALKEARTGLHKELQQATQSAKDSKLGKYGGWATGPKFDATGHFRTQKIDGKWWFIDPEGFLFFSVGTCLTGHTSETVINAKRLDAGFFAYLPGEDDYLRWAGRKKRGGREFVNFPAINLQRFYGEQWKEVNRNGIHHRMRAWGVNTLGSWSDPDLQKDARTPYTLMASIWWQASGHRKFPSPFREDYEADIRKAVSNFAWAKDDPYCLGIYLGNELDWPDKFTPKVFELPETDATKGWVRNRLKETYPDLAALNAAWNSNYGQWDHVLVQQPIPKAAFDDIEPFYLDFTTAFFSRAKKAISEVLPHTLYLGCRTHRGPHVLGRGAQGHADVFSVNVYDSEVRSWQVPNNVDMPILASEFHFGAVDRGVPSPGLAGSWNQRQRGLAFVNYLASALAEPRFVGVHWFQWIDQSAAGRSDRENHQCGFVDVTQRAYPEFVDAVSTATQAMYPARRSGKRNTEQMLEQLIAKAKKEKE